MEHTIYTCAECPFCNEGSTSDEFYCEHPQRAVEAAEPLAIFDGIPSWCPIKSDHVTIHVPGGK